MLLWLVRNPFPHPNVSWLTLAVIALTTALSTRFKFSYQGLGVTPTLAFETAAAILVGPWWALWVSLAAMLLDMWLYRHHYQWYQQVFNTTQCIISFGLGMGVVAWLGGSPGQFDFRSVIDLGAVAIGLSVYLVGSAFLIALAIWLSRRKPLGPLLTQLFSTATLYHLALIPVGVVLAALYTVNPALAPIPLLLILAIHKLGDLKTQLARDAQATIETMARLVDERDRYTHEHSKRVAVYACAIGQAMGLPAEQLDCLRRGCLIHDIGKVVWSDHILKGEGRLTPDQWEEVRDHAEVGYELVKDLDPYRNCAMIVRHHHERFDGKGYPTGLPGEAIPMLARIAGVADAFDAMTSRRPYRNAVTPDEALEELARHAGSQFDPSVVAVAMTALREAARQHRQD